MITDNQKTVDKLSADVAKLQKLVAILLAQVQQNTQTIRHLKAKNESLSYEVSRLSRLK